MNAPTESPVQSAVMDIYGKYLDKKEADKPPKEEEEVTAEETSEGEEDRPLTRKEKRERAMSSWKNVLLDITGEDLEYIPVKKRKKKYTKWIGDEVDDIALLKKPKKKKKVNYHKEFEPELNMLKSLIADQNKYTQDLQRRYQLSVGPNTRDASPLNKTQVDLASAVIQGRTTALSIIREIGSLKKTKWDLYIKDQKNVGGEDLTGGDPILSGAQTAARMLDSSFFNRVQSPSGDTGSPAPPAQVAPADAADVGEFDPESWGNEGAVDAHTKYENTPTQTFVELNRTKGETRFYTINTDTQEELLDYPNPTFTISKLDETNLIAKDSFDKVYPVKIVE